MAIAFQRCIKHDFMVFCTFNLRFCMMIEPVKIAPSLQFWTTHALIFSMKYYA